MTDEKTPIEEVAEWLEEHAELGAFSSYASEMLARASWLRDHARMPCGTPYRDRVIQLESLIAGIKLTHDLTAFRDEVEYVAKTSIAATTDFSKSMRLSPNVRPLEDEMKDR